MNKKNNLNELRIKAEKIAVKRDFDYSNLTEEKMRKMVENLEIHAIELELQNEELQNTQNELAVLNAKYLHLFQFAPVGYITLDKQHKITEANHTFSGIIGRTQFEKSPIDNFLHPDSQDRFYLAMIRAEKEQNLQRAELRLHNAGKGTYTWCLLEIVYEVAAESFLVSISDISKLKETQNELKVKRNYLQAVLSSMNDLLFIVDKDGVFIDYNKSESADDLYLPPERFMNRSYREILPFNIVSGIDAAVKKLNEGAQVQQFDYALQINGNMTFYESNISEFCDEDKVRQGYIISVRNVDDRVKTQEALKESEQRRRLAQKAAKIGTWEWDIKNDRIIWDEEVFKIFGEKNIRPFITGQEFLDYLHSDDRGRVAEELDKALSADRLNYACSYRIIKGDDSLSHIYEQAAIYRNETGDAVKTIGVLYDISEQKIAEQKLKESEERYSAIFERTLNAIVIISPDGFMVQFNQAACDQLGYTREEYAKLHISQIDVHDRPEKVRERIRLIKKKGLLNFETQHKNKQGEVLDILVSASFIKIRSEEYTLAVFNNISPIKEAEKEIRRYSERLSEAQKLAQMGSWELDIIKNQLHWSDEIYRIFNTDPQEFNITYEAFLGFIHPEDREKVNKAYLNSLKTKRPYEIEHRIITKDNSLKYVLERGTTEYDADGNPLLSRGIVYDITGKHLAQVNQQKNTEAFKLLSETASHLLTLSSVESILAYCGKILGRLVPEAYHSIDVIDLDKNTVRIIDIVGADDAILAEAFEKVGIDIKSEIEFRLKDDLDTLYPKTVLMKYENGLSDLLSGMLPPAAIKWLKMFLSLNDAFGIGIYPDEKIFAGVHMFTHHNNFIENQWIVEIFVQQISARLKILLDEKQILKQNKELKKQEKDLQEALEVKEVLLKEVHHRVKNNLQTIGSLLYQQKELSDDLKIQTALQDSMNRVSSMALIHEHIYKSDDLESINTQKYIMEFTKKLMNSYHDCKVNLDVNMDVQDIQMSIDEVIFIALIVNEILSNMFKYAFKGKETGTVKIKLNKRENGKTYFLLKDNGVGLPVGFDPRKSKTLGMYLIKNIAERQLRGSLNIQSVPGEGTAFEIIF